MKKTMLSVAAFLLLMGAKAQDSSNDSWDQSGSIVETPDEVRIRRIGQNKGLFIYAKNGSVMSNNTMMMVNGSSNGSDAEIMRLNSYDAGARMFIKNDGQTFLRGPVGIGTVLDENGILQNLDGQLHIKNDGHSWMTIESNGNGGTNAQVKYINGGHQWYGGVNNGGDFFFLKQGHTAPTMVMNDYQRVGIGITNPQARVHISNGYHGFPVNSNSDLVVEHSTNATIQLAGANKSSLLFSSGTDSYVGGVEYDHSLNDMRFVVNNQSLNNASLTLASDGNVGLGIVNPNTKLHVNNGNSNLNMHGWADVLIEDDTEAMIQLNSPVSSFIGFGGNQNAFDAGIQYKTDARELAFRMAAQPYEDALLKLTSDGKINANGLLKVSQGDPSFPIHSHTDLLIEDDHDAMIQINSPSKAYLGFGKSDDAFIAGIEYDQPSGNMRFRVNNQGSDEASLELMSDGSVKVKNGLTAQSFNSSKDDDFISLSQGTLVSRGFSGSPGLWIRDNQILPFDADGTLEIGKTKFTGDVSVGKLTSSGNYQSVLIDNGEIVTAGGQSGVGLSINGSTILPVNIDQISIGKTSFTDDIEINGDVTLSGNIFANEFSTSSNMLISKLEEGKFQAYYGPQDSKGISISGSSIKNESGRINLGSYTVSRGSGAIGAIFKTNSGGNMAPYILWDPTSQGAQKAIGMRQEGDKLYFTSFSDDQYSDRQDLMTLNGVDATMRVGGKIISQEIEVKADAWADFVFDENYQLKTLSEVDAYIQENGHLPEVPSTEEVMENGIDLAEMNATLLQKIEELTLYVIEQEKRIQSLETSK